MKLGLAVGAATALLALSGSASSAVAVNTVCAPAQTRDLIKRFVTAFNRGDARALSRIWGSKPSFQWYSVSNDPGQRIQSDAYRRDTLLSYFATRHTVHERMTLTSIKINSTSAGYRNFQYQLLRSADDLSGGPIAYEGKGAEICRTAQLGVWSMGATGS